MNLPGRRTKTANCLHAQRKTTVLHGLERRVCHDCGDVFIRTVSESLTRPGVLFREKDSADHSLESDQRLTQ